jgi:hypothetical protein
VTLGPITAKSIFLPPDHSVVIFFHNVIACSLVADGRDGFEIGKVAADTQTFQCRIAKRV